MKSKEVRESWRDVLDEVYANKTDIIIERYNKPVAVLISLEKYQLLEELMQERSNQ